MRLKYRVNRPCVRVGALKAAPLDLVDIEQVRHDLSIRNGAYWTAAQSGLSTEGKAPFLELFEVTSKLVKVPRHYDLPLRPGVRLDEVDFIHPLPRANGVTHTIRLRDDVQREASTALSRREKDKILTLSCGKGKTVVSLHAATEGKRFPLLVVVHTNALMDQWRDRISEFITIDGGAPDIGHVQASKEVWKGKKIVIAMLHSLVLKQYPKEFYDYFRLVIFDEAHRLGAELFSKAAAMFRCERWGLSATVKRPDGMDKVFRLHLGKVAYENLDQPLVPKCFFVKTGINVPIQQYIFRRGMVNMARLTTTLALHEERNKNIAYWINKAARYDRTILVLGERLQQLTLLKDLCDSRSKSLHIGAMSQEERAEALRHQVVFATQHLAKEGLDRPAFDTLFILVPFGGEGRLQQSVGRILRIHEAKKQPRVFIFEDNIGICMSLCRKMRRYLFQEQFEVVDVSTPRG